MNSSISPVDIRPDHLEIVQDILREHLPAGFRVWVFGSRANWRTKDSSDLDLAMEGADALDYKAMVGLEVAFEESDLPYTVDVVDLNAVSPEFKNIVEAQRIPLPPAAPRKVSSEWRKVTLGELTENFDAIRVPVKESDRKAGPYPYYGASGVVDRVDGFLFDGQYLLIAEDGENLRTRATPIAFLADGRFWVNNHAHIVRGNHHADTRFLNYALSNLDISGYLTGSTMPKLTQRNMNQILLTVPPLPEQRRIARILGTLDDKIELNRRKNRTLEAMARAIFQDWFVDFGPTRAKMEGQEPYMPPELWDLFPDELVDSELGEIPEGWTVAGLGEIISIHDSARIPLNSRQRAQRQGQYPYYGAAGIMDYVDDFLFDGVHILTGEDGSVMDNDGYPVVQYVWGQFWVNNHAHVMKGKNGVSDQHLYLVLKEQNIGAFVTGAVQPKLSQGNLKSVPIVKPDITICQTFAALTDPIFSSFRHHSDESHILSAQRDTLLPKLVSGEKPVATQ